MSKGSICMCFYLAEELNKVSSLIRQSINVQGAPYIHFIFEQFCDNGQYCWTFIIGNLKYVYTNTWDINRLYTQFTFTI